MERNLETAITIQLVHGGFILSRPTASELGDQFSNYKTEVFTSQAKLMKAVKAAVEEFSLVPSTKKDADAAE
jgi:hypothetical protein